MTLVSNEKHITKLVNFFIRKTRKFFSKNIVWSKLPTSKQFAQKDGFRYFMEKEIYEQSVVVSDCMLGRVKDSEINLF